MSMVCPQCHNSYEQRLECPTCEVRLRFVGPQDKHGESTEVVSTWQTPWGRMFIGILLAQGLYLGLRKICTAGLLAFGDSFQNQVTSGLFGLLFLQLLQIAGLILGATLAGAGQKWGFVLGGVVGLLNGVLSILFQEGTPHSNNLVMLLGLPPLHVAFGAGFGHFGSTIWKPLNASEEPKAAISFEKKILPAKRFKSSTFSGPVAWIRVAFGASFAVCGTLFAKKILDSVLEISDGKLSTDSYLQAELITWEVRALAILAGAALAGSNTVNGLKQGFAVGLAVSMVHLFGSLSARALPLDQTILTVGCALSLGIVGGWFGGQLFPPCENILKPRYNSPGSI